MKGFRLRPRGGVTGTIYRIAAKWIPARAGKSREPRRPQRSGFFRSENRSGSSPIEGCSIGASTGVMMGGGPVADPGIVRHVAVRGGAAPAVQNGGDEMHV